MVYQVLPQESAADVDRWQVILPKAGIILLTLALEDNSGAAVAYTLDVNIPPLAASSK